MSLIPDDYEIVPEAPLLSMMNSILLQTAGNVTLLMLMAPLHGTACHLYWSFFLQCSKDTSTCSRPSRWCAARLKGDTAGQLPQAGDVTYRCISSLAKVSTLRRKLLAGSMCIERFHCVRQLHVEHGFAVADLYRPQRYPHPERLYHHKQDLNRHTSGSLEKQTCVIACVAKEHFKQPDSQHPIKQAPKSYSCGPASHDFMT